MKPALRLLAGSARPRPTGLLSATIWLAHADHIEALAFRDLMRSDHGHEFDEASDRWEEAKRGQANAELRMRRAELQAAGRKWLEVTS